MIYSTENGSVVFRIWLTLWITIVIGLIVGCYMIRSYDHLQVEIYLIGFTRLTTDPLFLEYS
jgi:hypothetical protein